MRNVSIPINGNKLGCWKHDFGEKSAGVPLLMPLRGLTCPAFFLPEAVQVKLAAPQFPIRMPHKLCKISMPSAYLFSGHFRRNSRAVRASLPPPPCRRGFMIFPNKSDKWYGSLQFSYILPPLQICGDVSARHRPVTKWSLEELWRKWYWNAACRRHQFF